MMLIVVLPSLCKEEKHIQMKKFCCDCVVKSKAKTYNRLQARENMQHALSAGKHAYAKSLLVMDLLLIGWNNVMFVLIG